MMRTVLAEGIENPEEGLLLGVNAVGSGYFETLGIPLVRGRTFQPSDRADSLSVAVVNETLAERLWPGREAIGRRLTLQGEETPVEIVGVVRKARYQSITEEPQPYLYLPLEQRYGPQVELIVRARGNPETLGNLVRREVRALDPNVPVIDPETVEETIAASQWGLRMIATLLSVFGGLGLVLAAMGLYSILAYNVYHRRREIGIRTALGAQRGDVVRLILGQALSFVTLGLILGGFVAFLSSRLAEKLLFGISATDPATFATVAAVLASVALLASLLPALRAARIEPRSALRAE